MSSSQDSVELKYFQSLKPGDEIIIVTLDNDIPDIVYFCNQTHIVTSKGSVLTPDMSLAIRRTERNFTSYEVSEKALKEQKRLIFYPQPKIQNPPSEPE